MKLGYNRDHFPTYFVIEVTLAEFTFAANVFYYANYGTYIDEAYMARAYLRFLLNRRIRIAFEYFDRG